MASQPPPPPRYMPMPAPRRVAPTGPQLSPAQKAGWAALPGETEAMRRRRLAQQALVLGGAPERLGDAGYYTQGDGGDGSGGGSGAAGDGSGSAAP